MDIITRLAEKNLCMVLEKIFLSLNCQELNFIPLVCTSWYDIVHIHVWKSSTTRRILRKRLDQRWQNEVQRRVEMTIEGVACRENCELNYRNCDCSLISQVVNGSRLVIVLGSKLVKISYSINDDKHFSNVKQFDRQQYQISFSLKNDLKLDEKSFLSKPVFFKSRKYRTKIVINKVIEVQVDETDKTFLLAKCLNSQNTICRFQPLDYHTGTFNNSNKKLFSKEIFQE